MGDVIYWRIHVNVRGDYNVYFKTKKRYVPDMIVALAVQQKHLIDVFAECVDEVKEITEQEYFEYMTE
jgi:hypothetical protein